MRFMRPANGHGNDRHRRRRGQSLVEFGDRPADPAVPARGARLRARLPGLDQPPEHEPYRGELAASNPRRGNLATRASRPSTRTRSETTPRPRTAGCRRLAASRPRPTRRSSIPMAMALPTTSATPRRSSCLALLHHHAGDQGRPGRIDRGLRILGLPGQHRDDVAEWWRPNRQPPTAASWATGPSRRRP